jgi:Ca2+-binding EF-hand superfamily protein
MVWPLLDSDGSGGLDLREFVTFVNKSSIKNKEFKQMRKERHTIINVVSEKERARRIKSNTELEKLLQRSMKRVNDKMEKSGKSSREWFGLFDTDGSGDIDQKELVVGMAKCGAIISAAEVEIIWPTLCTSGEPDITFNDWERFLNATVFNIRTVRKKLNQQMMTQGKCVQELMATVEGEIRTRASLPLLDIAGLEKKKRPKKIVLVTSPKKRPPQRTFTHRKLKTNLDLDSTNQQTTSPSAAAATGTRTPRRHSTSRKVPAPLPSTSRKLQTVEPSPTHDPSVPVVMSTNRAATAPHSSPKPRTVPPKPKRTKSARRNRAHYHIPIKPFRPSKKFISKARQLTDSLLLGKRIPKIPPRRSLDHKKKLPSFANSGQVRSTIMKGRISLSSSRSVEGGEPSRRPKEMNVVYQPNTNWGCIILPAVGFK